MLYIGIRHWHANGWSSDHIHHQNMLFQPLFQPIHHRNTVWWKCHIASTILVLSLWQLGQEFPSCMYCQYHGTIAHASDCSSRLVVILVCTMVPNPHGTWYTGTRPDTIGPRCRPKYQATIATRQKMILVIIFMPG